MAILGHDEFRLQRHHPVGATSVADTSAWKCSVLSLARLRVEHCWQWTLLDT
jgi:hypothetical protein